MACDDKNDKPNPCEGKPGDSCYVDTCAGDTCDSTVSCVEYSSTEWTFIGFPNNAVSDMAFDSRDSKIIYVTTYGDFSAGVPGLIFKSTDCGQTWDTIGIGLAYGGGITGVVIDSSDPNIIYVASQAFNKSTNGGNSWVLIKNGMQINGESRARDLIIDPYDHNTLLASAGGFGSGSIYKSTDGGLNWINKTGVYDDITSLSFTESGNATVFAGGVTVGGVYKSTDNGETWDTTGMYHNAGVLRLIYKSGTLYAPANYILDTSRSGLYISKDMGETWSREYVRGSERNFAGLIVTGESIYAGTETGCYKRDSINVWTNFGLTLYINKLVINPAGTNLYAATYHGLFVRKIK